MSESKFYTARGDDGQTGLLGPERVPKYDLRPEAYGTVDEAQAALGLARSAGCTPDTAITVLTIQRDLHSLMAELASIGNQASPFAGAITIGHVEQIEAWIAQVEAEVEMPKEFIIPGDSQAGAALHLARTVVRRAERIAVRLADESQLANPQVVRYLNRLSSLFFALAIFEDLAATSGSPTLAKKA